MNGWEYRLYDLLKKNLFILKLIPYGVSSLSSLNQRRFLARPPSVSIKKVIQWRCWPIGCADLEIIEYMWLTRWGRVTHICVNKLTIIGSDNGSSPGRRQAIIWTNAGILFIRPLGTNFSEILVGIQTFSVRKMHLKVSSAL